ncbi:MAG: nucleotidyltransferase domain-containing protein [Leptolyngbya sp. SIO4C5]|nr:nucleotidyltransferase domain-containing protein [Leptolyngbya sp. SIO4C5]
MSISAEKMAQYRAGAAQRAQRQQQARQVRYQQGWAVARRAAEILKNWGASQVVLFGSLLDVEKVHARSDIDLAVWDLPAADYYSALAELLDIDPDFAIDLVEIQNAKPHILKAIESGVAL